MPKKKRNDSSFHYKATQSLPKLGKIQTTWALSTLYYKNLKDPQIEKDIKKAERAYHAFVSKWTKKSFVHNAKVLKESLQEYEALLAMPETSKVGRYLSLRLALNVNDTEAEKMSALLRRRFRKLGDSMLFYSLTLGAIAKTQQKKFLHNKDLQHFHYFLERLFLEAAHHLSEAEEKIINLKQAQAYGMWVDMVEKIISNRKIVWKKEEIAIPHALEKLDNLKSQDKPKLWSLLMREMQSISEVAEHEFNAIITDVRTEDELRGFTKPYSSTALNYEDTEASIENLVATVSKEGFRLSRAFYKLKAEYHNKTQLHYSQKYDTIGTEVTIPFSEAVMICRDVFYSVHTEYGQIFDEMLTSGKIDVYPKAGKQGGAFMSAQTGHPIQVFLNYADNFKSLETLAHEMGHAIHAARSATNSPLYDGHSITTAETASTLFENLVFDAVYEQASETQKMVLLHDRLTRDIATIQRQIAFFNAELEIHNTIHREGAMTAEELRLCMKKHLTSYLGSAVQINPEDGYSFVYIPHLRYGFYVYTYSFGLLMSTHMANLYKADPSYVEQIDRFLRAGETATVANIFKSIDINIEASETYQNALQLQSQDIATFRKLVRQNR